MDITDVPARTLSKLRGVQLQDSRLAFAFTVADTVAMGRAPWHGTPAQERDTEVVAAAMTLAEVADLASLSVPVLSGGERARTAFARLLAQETAILLLDEPTAALDIRHQERVMALARRRADAGAAVLVILHDLSLAAACADRIVLLSQGRIRADGPPERVLDEQLVSEVYDHPVRIIPSPETGDLLVVPLRTPRISRLAPAEPEITADLPLEQPA